MPFWGRLFYGWATRASGVAGVANFNLRWRVTGKSGAPRVELGGDWAEDLVRERYSRLIAILVRRLKANLRSMSPRDTGRMARGWRVTRRTRSRTLRANIKISNPSARYWRFVNFDPKSKHHLFMDKIIDQSVREAMAMWTAEKAAQPRRQRRHVINV